MKLRNSAPLLSTRSLLSVSDAKQMDQAQEEVQSFAQEFTCSACHINTRGKTFMAKLWWQRLLFKFR